MRTLMIAMTLALTTMMAHAEDRTTAKTTGLRISTGVVAPKLVKTVDIQSTMRPAQVSAERAAIVSMVVDGSGKPTALKVVQSSNEATDQSVLNAVSQFRFTPGSVSGQTVDVPMNLVVNIQ